MQLINREIQEEPNANSKKMLQDPSGFDHKLL